MHIAGGVVIGIKQVGVLRNFRAIARHPDFHDERFEEPARVGEMPLRRAHVGHRLHDVIFRLEIPAKTRREIPDTPIALDQMLALVGADIVLAAWSLGHKSVRRLQNS